MKRIREELKAERKEVGFLWFWWPSTSSGSSSSILRFVLFPREGFLF